MLDLAVMSSKLFSMEETSEGGSLICLRSSELESLLLKELNCSSPDRAFVCRVGGRFLKLVMLGTAAVQEHNGCVTVVVDKITSVCPSPICLVDGTSDDAAHRKHSVTAAVVGVWSLEPSPHVPGSVRWCCGGWCS